MNYQITCACGHRFFINERQLAGVNCPSCGRPLIPVVTPPPTEPPAEKTAPIEPATDPASPPPTEQEPAIAASAEATKRCPFCGEVILAIARKCKHCGEFLDRANPPTAATPAPTQAAATSPSPAVIQSPAPAPVPTATQQGLPTTGEQPVFAMSVSQWDNFWKYLICATLAVVAAWVMIWAKWQYAALGVPLTVVGIALVAWFFWLSTRNSKCIIRPMRIETEVGILSKDLNSLEIFRITDVELKQNIFERLLGIGTVRITANDPSTPELILYQIPKARAVYRYLQQQVPIAARQRGAVLLDR